jgi:hypothetical protein
MDKSIAIDNIRLVYNTCVLENILSLRFKSFYIISAWEIQKIPNLLIARNVIEFFSFCINLQSPLTK